MGRIEYSSELVVLFESEKTKQGSTPPDLRATPGLTKQITKASSATEPLESVNSGQESYYPGTYGPAHIHLNKYTSNHGRDVYDDMTVARIYLTGLTNKGISSKDLGVSVSGKALKKMFTNNAKEDDKLASRAYVGFILESVQEKSEEKAQLNALNGDRFVAHFMGASPSVYRFTGRLLNTKYDEWRTIFSELFRKVFRGSVVARTRQMVQVAYDGKIVTGAMVGLEQSLSSMSESSSQFSFSLLVYHVLETDVPTADRYASTFLGNAANFGKVSVQDPTADPDAVNSALVAPPPKPRRARKKSKRTGAACKPVWATNTSGQTVNSGDIGAQNLAAAQKCIKDVKDKEGARKLLDSSKGKMTPAGYINLKEAIGAKIGYGNLPSELSPDGTPKKAPKK